MLPHLIVLVLHDILVLFDKTKYCCQNTPNEYIKNILLMPTECKSTFHSLWRFSRVWFSSKYPRLWWKCGNFQFKLTTVWIFADLSWTELHAQAKTLLVIKSNGIWILVAWITFWVYHSIWTVSMKIWQECIFKLLGRILIQDDIKIRQDFDSYSISDWTGIWFEYKLRLERILIGVKI